jgi:general secretion pathway protein G
MSKSLTSRCAFSLMEMLAVVTVLGIIAALIVPRVLNSSDTAKEQCCAHNCTEIDISVERYYIHNGAWPADNLSDIGADVDYFPEGLPTCPVSGAVYRLDPATHRVLGHAGSGDHNP